MDTLQLYPDTPADADVIPDYARELKAADGRQYTGFGADVKRNGIASNKNFVIGETSSYG